MRPPPDRHRDIDLHHRGVEDGPPHAGEGDVWYALIYRGIAMGFLFTPINNVAYGVLEPSEAQRASDLIKLSRQLGESFGIAILSTYVTTHIQMHRADSHLQSVLDQSRRHGEIVS